MTATDISGELVRIMNTRARTTLLDIGQELTALSELMLASADENGELPPDVAAQLDAWFAELSTDLEEKIDNTAAFHRVLKLRAAIRKEEAERLLMLHKVDATLAERIKRRLHLFMTTTGPAKIKTRRFSLSVCGNGGVQPMDVDQGVCIGDVPLKYRKQVLDHDAVRADLEAGATLTWARLRDRGSHLRGL